MAVIKLTIQPTKESLEATVRTINEALGNIKGLNIKVDSGAAQATQNIASGLERASRAAMEYDSRLNNVRDAAKRLESEFGNLQRIVGTTFDEETKQFTQAVAEFGRAGEEVRRVAIAFDEAGEATHSLVSGTEDVAAAAKRAARESEKAAKEAQKEQEALDKAYVEGYTQREKEIEKKQRETWKAFLKEKEEYEAEQEKLENEKVEQAIAANRRMVKEEEEAQRRRSAEWKAHIDNINEAIKAEEQAAEQFKKLKLEVSRFNRKQDEEGEKEAEKLRQMELEAERQLAKELDELHQQQRSKYAELEAEQAKYLAKQEAEAHRKNAEAIRFEAEEQAKARKEKEQAADAAVQLERQYSNLIRQIENLKQQYPEGTFDEIEKQAREARDELRNLDRTTENYAQEVNRLGKQFQGYQRDVANAREETHKLDKVTESFWMNIQKFARWYIGGNIVTKVIGSLREALATMKEVDTELANIQKVTDRTDQQMQRTAEAAYKVASAYGVAAQDYLESVAEFAKAGFGDMSEQLAEIATKTQLVGDVSSSVANKFLIASNAAWKMNGNIDKLNKTLDAANIIENNYATSIEKLAAGMPIAASVAANAGMTFEETIAALGTITSVTQETGTKAATALRALILNIIGAVGEYEDGIEVTEESVKSLDGILRIYASDAMKAADAAGTVVNPMEAIAALAKASEEGLVNQAELFEILSSLGGKLRTNQLISLVQNFDMMQEMLDKTTQSAGSADKEIGVMLDTWEAKTNILKNTWTEFIASTINSNFIKSILDISTAVVDFADNAGLAATAAAGLMLVFKGKEVVGAIKEVKNVFQDLSGVLKGVTTSMTATTTAVGLLVVAVSAFIMIYRQVEQARRESLEKAATEAASIQNLTDKYDDLTEKLDNENLSRDELITLLKKSTEKYNEEWESINDVNELREIAIGLINEETKAKAKQYTIDNQAAYRMSQNILSGDRKVNMDYGGIHQQYSYEEAIAFYEKAIDDAMKAENMTNAQAHALGVLTDEYKRLKKEYEEAQTTVDAYETALSILDGTYERVEEHTRDLGTAQDGTSKYTKSLTEKLAEASEAATAYDTAISEVKTALDEFGAGSIEVYNAMVKLEAAIPGSTDKLYDFETATWKIDASMIASKSDLLDFIDTQKQLEFSSAISELESVAAAYWDIAGAAVAAMTNQQAQAQMSGVLALTGGGASQAHYDIAQSQLAGVKAQKAEWDAYIATLRARSGYSDGGGGGSGSSASAKTTDAELERLKAIVRLEKSELSFLQASGKSLDEINAKRKEIQAALHDQAEYMRSVLAAMDDTNSTEAERKAYEEAILALSTEWWNIQQNINDDLAKAEEERLKQLEEEQRLLEEQKQLQQEMFDNLKSIVDDYYAKLISDKEEELSLEEKILAVQKAEAALANAQRERTVRYYNAATGQWEWQANAKNVKSAQDALKKAQDDLSKYQRDLAWKEFKAAWEYVSEQIKAGDMTFQEAYDYMYNAMTEIQDKYGVDLGVTLEDSIGGFKNLNYGIDGLTQEVADSLGASVGVLNERLKEYESAVGALQKAFEEVSEKVKNGEMSMEDAYEYLRDRAKEIADKYGIDMTGALEEAIAGMDKTNMSIDELWKAVIINLMKVNSARWFDASDEEKAMLHAQNEYLGGLIGATYDPNGFWYLNGSLLYGSQKGADYTAEGYGSKTGGGGGGYGGGGYGGGGYGGGGYGLEDAGDGVYKGRDGYYDSYGNFYETLDDAIAGNASISAQKKKGGKTYYGKAFDAIYMSQLRWTDPELWAEYSKLAEADPEYAARLLEMEEAIRNGASQEELTRMKNALYSDFGMGYFGSIHNGGNTTGFVKAGYGNANGEYLLILNGMLYETGVNPGTMLQDLWGNRWIVGEDGQTLTPIEAAWDPAMMDMTNNDLSYMGADVLTEDTQGLYDSIDNSSVENYGDTYNIAGISIGEKEAKSMTVYELVTLAGGLGNFSGT